MCVEQRFFIALEIGNVFSEAGDLRMLAIGGDAGKRAFPEPAKIAVLRNDPVVAFRGLAASLHVLHAGDDATVLRMNHFVPGGGILRQGGGRAAENPFKGAADVIVLAGFRVFDPEDLVDIFGEKEELLLAALQFVQHSVNAGGEAREFVAAGDLNALGERAALSDAHDFAAEAA